MPKIPRRPARSARTEGDRGCTRLYGGLAVRSEPLAPGHSPKLWDYFGRQQVIYKDTEESIPHVGIWEDDDLAHSARVNLYWRAVGLPDLNGKDCQQPWSAAFISWLMTMAGVPEEDFPPA